MALLLIRNLKSEVFQCDLISDRVTLGRHPENDIPLDDPQISTFHAAFEKIEKGWRFTDLGSSNGSVLNGHRVLEVLLKDRDLLTLGGCSIIYLEREEDVENVELPLSPHAQANVGTTATSGESQIQPSSDLPTSEAPVQKTLPRTTSQVPVRTPATSAANPNLVNSNIKNRMKQFKKRDSDGCGTLLVVVIFAILGFVTALAVRHHQETGRNFFVDLFSKAPVKIEIKKD